MSDERALRSELETLQHGGKNLRAELDVPHAPAFLTARDELVQQLTQDTPTLGREEQSASVASAKEAELLTAIELARSALASAEQRRLSPTLALVPFVSLCLLSSWAIESDTLLADKGFARALASVATAVAGLILGRRLWAPRAEQPVQAPLRERTWAAFSTHFLFNGSAWATLPLAACMPLLITSAATLSHRRLLSFAVLAWCQLLALGAFALALKSLRSVVSAHRSFARVEAIISIFTLGTTALWADILIGNVWFNGGGLVAKLALGTAMTLPFAVALGWYWLERGEPRPLGLWLLPGLLCLLASGLLASNASAEELSYEAGEETLVPSMLARDEVEFLFATRRAEEANAAVLPDGLPATQYKPGTSNYYRDRERNGALRATAEARRAELQVAATRRSFDVCALLLASEFALISLCGAWFFSGVTGRRGWLVRALPLLPVLALVGAVLARGTR